MATVSTIYAIADRDSDPAMDARIELDGGAVKLHSRGGATGGRPPRNKDYSSALRLVIRRLRAHDEQLGPTIKRVAIDSRPARQLASEDRTLLTSDEISKLTDEELVTAIQRTASRWGQVNGTSGGNGTKAIRIETERDTSALRSALRLRLWQNGKVASVKAGSAAPAKLSFQDQYKVSLGDIQAAVEMMLAGKDAPSFSKSRDYDVLLDDGTRLAPKKVFGLALERALGIEAKPSHFSAGWGQPSFILIEAAGFAIVPKNSANGASRTVAEKIADGVPPPPEDVVFIEGDRRMAKHFRVERSRDAKAPRLKRQKVLETHKRLVCERCESDQLDRYDPAIVDRVFEIHHKVPPGSVDEAQEVRLQDLECLCASCHRAVHRAMALGLKLPDPASISALREAKAENQGGSSA